MSWGHTAHSPDSANLKSALDDAAEDTLAGQEISEWPAATQAHITKAHELAVAAAEALEVQSILEGERTITANCNGHISESNVGGSDWINVNVSLVTKPQ